MWHFDDLAVAVVIVAIEFNMSTAVNIGSNVTRGRYQLALLSSCHLHKKLIRVTRTDSELVMEMHEVLKVAYIKTSRNV